MYLPAYVPPNYNVTINEHVWGIPVSTPVSHEKLIETMTIGKPEEKPFKFLALVSEARIAIHLSMNLAVFNSCVKQSNPQRTFVCKALSFLAMKKNKSGDYDGVNIEIEPDEFKVSGNMLFLDKNFNTPAVTSLRNRTLWSLAIKINEIWINDIAIDIVVFPSFAKMQKFCEQKEFDSTNPLLRLSPFWFNPAVRETESKTDAKVSKRSRDTFPKEANQWTNLGYVSDKHQVRLWTVNSESKVSHQDLIEQMSIGKVNEDPFPVPCLVSKRVMKITIAINLRSLENHAKNAPQKTEGVVEKLVFYQQKCSKGDLIARPLPVKPTFFEITEEKLCFETVFELPETSSSLKSKSLWNLAIKVYGIWIFEMGTDFALFDNFTQMEDYCYKKRLDDDNALFKLSPFWYNQNMRDKYSSFTETKTPKKLKSHIKDESKLDSGIVKNPLGKLDLFCYEDISTFEEKPYGRGSFSTEENIPIHKRNPVKAESKRARKAKQAEQKPAPSTLQKRKSVMAKSKRARNVQQAEPKTVPNTLDDLAPEPMVWEKSYLEPLFPELGDV